MVEYYQVLTANFRTVKIEELEHFMLPMDAEDDRVLRLKAIKEKYNIEELFYLTTCNRITCSLYRTDPLSSPEIKAFFEALNPRSAQYFNNGNAVSDVVEIYKGETAVKHHLELASSLNSLVVGEREIFRQYKKAYDLSRLQGLSGDKLRILVNNAIATAKEVYHKTKIAEKRVSVVSLALQKILQSNVAINDKICFIGAGEMITKAAVLCQKKGFTNLHIYNRTLENAKKLATQIDGTADLLSEFFTMEESPKVVISCVASQHPIIRIEDWNKLYPQNKASQRKTILVDLGIPLNVDKQVAILEDVDHINIEDLKELAKTNIVHRKESIAAADQIIRTYLEKFYEYYERRRIERALHSLPQEIKKIKEKAMNVIYKDKIEALPSDTQQLVHEMLNYMEKKCVAAPMRLAKSVETI